MARASAGARAGAGLGLGPVTLETGAQGHRSTGEHHWVWVYRLTSKYSFSTLGEQYWKDHIIRSGSAHHSWGIHLHSCYTLQFQGLVARGFYRLGSNIPDAQKGVHLRTNMMTLLIFVITLAASRLLRGAACNCTAISHNTTVPCIHTL